MDHTTTESGDPVLTKTGQANTVLPIRYLADAPYAVYQPGRPQDADTQHKYQSLEIPTGIRQPDPWGLFSNTYATKNATADTNFLNGTYEIVQERKPFSDLDQQIDNLAQGPAGDGMRSD